MMMGAVWKRFFRIVLVSIVALLTTGTNLYTTAFRAIKAATGQGAVPLGWNVMLVSGLLMMAIFGSHLHSGLREIQVCDGRSGLDFGRQGVRASAHMDGHQLRLGWLAIAAVRLLR